MATTADLQAIKAELDEISTALGGDNGVRVRLSVAEQRLGNIEKSLDDHRKTSSDNHTATQAALATLAAKQLSISLDPSSIRSIIALVLALLSALGLGVAGGHAVIPQGNASEPAVEQAK